MSIGEPPLAYVLQNQVGHIRLLPRPSKHSFVYPTLSVLVSLSALESKQLDLWRGWLFGYGSTWGRVTGLCPSAYLYSDPSDKRSIRGKVMDVLEKHGYTGGELDDAWLLTMPSFLGLEGINPLSVYFCYKRARDTLWLVILEVHNTFGERHVYVLDTSKSEPSPSTRFDCQWTFPRQFHVSPFNDRSGHYVCHLTAPSHTPSIPQDPPYLLIKLTLLTSPPRPQKKLIATLRTIHASPLSSITLLSSLIQTPFLLLLTFPRILYQAYLLHYYKSLDVYQRPEPCAPDPSVEAQLPAVRNAIQPDETGNSAARHGGVGWQHPGLLERWCQRRVHTHLQKMCSDTNIIVTLIPANPSEKCTTINPVHHPRSQESNVQRTRTLRIHYRSPRLFTLLFTSPSPTHALQLGVHADNVFAVSSEQLFTALFTAPSEASDTPRWRRLGLRLACHLRYLSVPESIALPIPTLHALDSYDSNPGMIIIILSVLFLLAIMERAIFSAVGARFVLGDEPWGGWGRVQTSKSARAGVSARPGGGLGSVRRVDIEESVKERKRLKHEAKAMRILARPNVVAPLFQYINTEI